MNVLSSWQVTIVTNNVPAVGGESGETRCQGDMEKADMVDGEKAIVFLLLFHVIVFLYIIKTSLN